MPPAELEARLVARTHAMLQAGWPQEAEWLAQQVDPQQRPQPTAWQALGYREALAAARGEFPVDEAAERIVRATRQYAKRQQTFFRRQLGAEPLLCAEQARAALLAAFGRGPGEL
ncbi:tRNA dimethylallyltransferase [Deinococcus lacus]|uniref:tRNA dimethylallyltransferase n=1 Tax=Deinococcus lacus TaxID=392561 RepID=A0ABW1YA94_9DEIO